MTVHSGTSNDHQPIFSFVTALCTLTLLYFPHSPWTSSSLSLVLVLTSLLLLLLLRLGSTRKQEETEENPSQTRITSSSSSGQVADEWAYGAQNGDDPGRGSGSSFVGWDFGAPLEVIHEEGGDHHSGLDLFFGSGRYPSLSSYYPETDSDSSASEEGGTSPADDWESPGNGFFEWEAEDREESLIEIALNRHGKMDPDTDTDTDPGLGFHFEEENWIEIDPVKKRSSSGFE